MAAEQFGAATAEKDLRRYRAGTLNPTTRLLKEEVLRAGGGRTLLDVGAGVGALSFELLDAGIERAVAVDAAPAYVSAAREEAAERGVADRFRVVEADFAERPRGEPADVVVMDRVVCCYPDMGPLLEGALERCRLIFAYSYPRNRFYVRLAVGLRNLARFVGRNPFRAYVHPARAMEALIAGRGFRRIARRGNLGWVVDVYAGR